MAITNLPTPPSRSNTPANFIINADAFIAALPVFVTEANSTAAAMNLNATNDTSASSVLIGTGTKTFTVSASKSFQPGMYLVIASTAAPSTNSMNVQITSYSGTTLIVNSISVTGSGTIASWTISQSVNFIPFDGSITTAKLAGSAKTNKIQPITATVASDALTLTLNPTTLDFRATTLGSGTVTTISNAANVSTVISSGSTAGAISAVLSRIVVLAINNAGTIELAWVNQSGGVNLDETGVISTTAEGGAGAADSAAVIYSTTARTGVAYRVVGYVDSTQATAGTWATAPSLIQGAGGQSVVPIAVKSTLNAAGDAPVYACRAWVNFNGTGTVAIRASGNVSSITDNGVGDYTVNFAMAMSDANYCALCSGDRDSAGDYHLMSGVRVVSTTACRVTTASSGVTRADHTEVTVSVFR